MPNAINQLKAMNKRDSIVTKTADPYKAEKLPAVTDEDAGKILVVDEDGKWAVDDMPVELPKVDGDDDGKVLMVVDGKWAVGTLPE